MRKFTATLFLLATLSLGTLAVTAVPAMAEEDMGQVNYQTDLGPFSYNVAQYPSHSTNFFFYPNSYVEFSVKNGKYWMLETSRFNMSMSTGRKCYSDLLGIAARDSSRLENFVVKFYTPDGVEIGSYKDARVNNPWSVPRDGENYENIKVRIENHSSQNIDARFIVWDPIDPVMAQPIDPVVKE